VHESLSLMETRVRAADARIENYAILLKPIDPPNPDTLPPKPKMIGVIGVFRFPAEVGYQIHPHFQKQGYITEILPAFIELFWSLYSHREAEQILAKIDVDNHVSKKVILKAGFKNTGHVEEKVFEVPGKGWRDLEVWACPRPSPWVDNADDGRWLWTTERLTFEVLDAEKHLHASHETWQNPNFFKYLYVPLPRQA
jgi:RimJ/RimL family protein N-acetyltransferase